MILGGQRSVATKLATLIALPIAAALTLSACSDNTNSATDVNITPVEPETTGADGTEVIENFEAQLPDDVDVYEIPEFGEIETTFELESPGLVSTVVLTGEDGLVTEQRTINEFEYAGMGWTEDDAEELLAITAEEMQGIAGVEHSVETGETSAVEELVVDMETVDLTETMGLSGSYSESGVSENSVIGYETTRELILEMGYVEVE